MRRLLAAANAVPSSPILITLMMEALRSSERRFLQKPHDVTFQKTAFIIHKLRVFENRVLRRIFGPKRDGVMGGLRKLHNEELHNLYSSPSIIRIMKSRRMRWGGHVTRMEEKRNV
jgi:hypothetical protein